MTRFSRNGIILCDCHLTVEDAEQFTEPSKIAFLLKEPGNLVDDYCNRPDHQGFRNFIHSATDTQKAKATCNETLRTLNEKRYHDMKNSRYFWLERDTRRTVEETVSLVERHFGWSLQEDLQIVKVEKGTELAQSLLQFVKDCSWTEAKEHIVWMLETWALTDWETMFAAVKGGNIVGMCTIMKTDYYPLPEIAPWVSCVFVSEEHRGNRISEKLISQANRYARDLGFPRSYIACEHAGLYEHYGYHYVKEIENYAHGIDHLFTKELT